ncbi:MAG: TMEM14 family protein [Microcystaceae cyanobacterium]
MINAAAIATLLYGILALIGGILGYLKARSQPSLISGLVSGILLIGTGLLQLAGIGWGKWLAVAITLALIVVFIIRWRKTRKWMPAGIMVIVGVACLVVMIP